MSPRAAAYSPFSRSLRRLQAAFWRRRVVHWLIRALWLALLAPTLFMAGYLWLGWQAHWSYWLYPLLGIMLASILWAVRPISLKKIAYRLDDRLGFRTQLITAYEVSQTETDVDNLVVHRLLHEGVNVVVNIRREVRVFNHTFWLEMQALIGVLVLLGAMLLLDALNPRLPNATLVELPSPLPEPAADEVIPPNPQLFPPPFAPEIQPVQALSGEAVQQALEALADALRDLAVTRAAAEAIDRGDLAGAAESLRGLADQLGELSEEARAELGDTLGEAADQVGDGAPGLSEPLQEGSQALGADNLGQAGQSLADLAEALEALQETSQETAQASQEPQPGEAQAQAESGSDPAAETEQPQSGEPESPPAESEAAEEEAEPAEQPAEGGGGAGEGDNEGEGQEQPTEAERLALEGQPLELESDSDRLEEQVLQPAELDAEPGDRLTEDSPFARGSASASTDLGPDPLTYPWDKREIIRRYFTP